MTSTYLAVESKDSPLRQNLRCYIDWNDECLDTLGRLISQLWDQGEAGVYDRKNMNGHITASMLVLSPDGKEVLAIHHQALGGPLLPCGHIHKLPRADGDLRVHALREIADATGVSCIEAIRLDEEFDIPLDIDTHEIPARAEMHEGVHVHHDFLFLGRAAAKAAPAPLAGKGSAAKWYPLQDFFNLKPTPRLERVKAKLLAMGVCA